MDVPNSAEQRLTEVEKQLHTANKRLAEARYRDQLFDGLGPTSIVCYGVTEFKAILPYEVDAITMIQKYGFSDLPALPATVLGFDPTLPAVPATLLGKNPSAYHQALLGLALDGKFWFTKLQAMERLKSDDLQGAMPEIKEICTELIRSLVAFARTGKGKQYMFNVLATALTVGYVVPKEIWAPEFSAGHRVQELAVECYKQKQRVDALSDNEEIRLSVVAAEKQKLKDLVQQWERAGGWGSWELQGRDALYCGRSVSRCTSFLLPLKLDVPSEAWLHL